MGTIYTRVNHKHPLLQSQTGDATCPLVRPIREYKRYSFKRTFQLTLIVVMIVIRMGFQKDVFSSNKNVVLARHDWHACRGLPTPAVCAIFEGVPNIEGARGNCLIRLIQYPPLNLGEILFQV